MPAPLFFGTAASALLAGESVILCYPVAGHKRQMCLIRVEATQVSKRQLYGLQYRKFYHFCFAYQFVALWSWLMSWFVSCCIFQVYNTLIYL